MGRRGLREHIFKLLFMSGFHPEEELADQVAIYLEGVEALQKEDGEYMQKKYAGIREKMPEIDGQLNEISRGWKTSRMNKVDLTILRLAVYEMKWDEEVPVGVAIDQAVELAKKYSSDEGPAFVNAVLAKLAD